MRARAWVALGIAGALVAAGAVLLPLDVHWKTGGADGQRFTDVHVRWGRGK